MIGSRAYLSQLKSVINFVLKWPHLYFADKFALDLSVTEYSREQFTEVGKEDIHFVVHGGIECRQGKPVIAQIALMEHVNQKWHN